MPAKEQLIDFAYSLKNVLESVPNGLIWILFAVGILIAGTFTAILIYHWKHFGVESKLIVKGERMYYIGIAILIIVMLVTAFMFTNK
ncbi:MAG: hypothetical protein K9L98_02025 [Candidatus Pacebacteria bacterium]|nr:hypothetical protein [Candidatus Paceibacterota bacterium]MCF7862764.1 hypothetical protein [Candidatus Paceibacterota bacterium]